MSPRDTVRSSGVLQRNRLTVLTPALGLALVCAITLGGCPLLESLIDNWQRTPLVAGLEKFSSAQDLEQYLREQYRNQNRTQYTTRNTLGWLFTPAAAPTGGAAAEDAADGTSNDDYSTTNVQEAGVDEGDIVKNDATYLYIIHVPQPLYYATEPWDAGGARIDMAVATQASQYDSELRIVQAIPATGMAVKSRLDLPGTVEEVYLRGDRLIAVGGRYDRGTETIISVVDVTDRANPVILKTLAVEGTLSTSRLIEERLHVVLQLYPDVAIAGDGDDPVSDGESTPGSPGAAAKAQTASDVSTLEQMIPDMVVVSSDGTSAQQDVVEWDEVYRPLSPAGYMMTIILTMDVDDLTQELKKTAVVGSTDTVYASTGALYLARTDYDYQGNRSVETTVISMLALQDEGAVYVGGGSVPGWLLNRFSLSEYQGYLRLATTIGRSGAWSGQQSSNNVYVLKAQDGSLDIVGRLEGLAPGEQIFSARFLGNRGFLVTFVQVDPLFTIDLSDPANPVAVGELKVPGYSDYIHPLGENHLLTIGKDSLTENGTPWYQGVQVSVFDVTNFAAPVQVDVEIFGERGTESEALHDPHAFSYYAPAEMLAVPIQLAENAGVEPWDYGQTTFDGLYLLHVTTAGIEQLARIAMRSASQYGDYWYWGNDWTRGVFIGDYVYAVSSDKVRAVPRANVAADPIELLLNP